VAADETLINGMACRPATTKQTASGPEVGSGVKAMPAAAVMAPGPIDGKKEAHDSTPAAAPKDPIVQSASRACVILKRMGPADEITSHLLVWDSR
jgi:hypothetical protein